MHKREDKRITRSRNALLKAFAELLETEPVGSITVSGICRRADVDRATFYRHYEDKQDLLERGVPQLVDEMIQRVGAESSADSRFPRRLELLFEEVSRRRELFRPLVSPNAGGLFSYLFSNRLGAFLYSARLRPMFPDPDRSNGLSTMLASMTVSSLVGLVRVWLTEHPEWDPHELSRVYTGYVYGAVGSFALELVGRRESGNPAP